MIVQEVCGSNSLPESRSGAATFDSTLQRVLEQIDVCLRWANWETRASAAQLLAELCRRGILQFALPEANPSEQTGTQSQLGLLRFSDLRLENGGGARAAVEELLAKGTQLGTRPFDSFDSAPELAPAPSGDSTATTFQRQRQELFGRMGESMPHP